MSEQDDHFTVSDLFEFSCGLRQFNEEASRHLQGCAPCQEEIRFLRTVRELGQAENRFLPPERAMDWVRKLAKRGPSPIAFVRSFVADLIYDSLNSPLPEGSRSAATLGRETEYSAPGLKISLKVQNLDDEKALIVGQISADNDRELAEINGLPVALIQLADVVSMSATDRWGEFMFEDVPDGTYELHMYFADRVLKLPVLDTTSR